MYFEALFINSANALLLTAVVCLSEHMHLFFYHFNTFRIIKLDNQIAPLFQFVQHHCSCWLEHVCLKRRIGNFGRKKWWGRINLLQNMSRQICQFLNWKPWSRIGGILIVYGCDLSFWPLDLQSYSHIVFSLIALNGRFGGGGSQMSFYLTSANTAMTPRLSMWWTAVMPRLRRNIAMTPTLQWCATAPSFWWGTPAFLCTSLHSSAFHCSSLHFSAFLCIYLHFLASLCIFCISQHFSAFYILYLRKILRSVPSSYGRHFLHSLNGPLDF